MYLILLLCSTAFAVNIPLIKSKYTIQDDRVTLDYFNKNYIKYGFIENVWYNRTIRTFNVRGETLRDLTDDFWITLEAYEFRSNVYHKFAPINFSVKIADIVNGNLHGVNDILKKHNIPNKMPIPKGYYEAKDVLGDRSMMPPILFPAKCKVVFTILDKKTEVIKFTWYGSIIENMKRS